MSATEMIKPPPRPPSADQQLRETSLARRSHFEPPPLEERLGEIFPLIGVVPVAGPPVILFVGAWALFALMLTGPFLLLVTFALVGFIVVTVTAAVLAPPYLLLHHLSKRRTVDREPHTSGRQIRELNSVGASLLTQGSNVQLFAGPAVQPVAAAHIHNPTPTRLTSEGL